VKLSISNIAWAAEFDEQMYTFLSDAGIDGLEIAPTRLFADNPYDRLEQARRFAASALANKLEISSMQSIWFGRCENIFASKQERESLVEYTKKAIAFAAAIGCGNLVFGCPKNRNIPDGVHDYEDIAVDFFSRIADYAAVNHTVIALEPNPPIYSTNFINTTPEAFELCRKINLPGFKVNIDVGTMLENTEPVWIIAQNLDIINHIHISEPKLVPIEKRDIHKEIFALDYNKYVSIEMGNCNDLTKVKNIIKYIKELKD
jgi:sugar phosphate isomerase/epimerase